MTFVNTLRGRREDAATVRRVAEEVLPFAVQTGDRAYQFVHLHSGFSEVRVWPDGTVKVTEVDSAGRPKPEPLPDLKL